MHSGIHVFVMKNGPSILAARWLHAALLLLVLSGVGNIYSHLCLDGQEPTLSVHFENFSSHTQHDDDSDVADVESESIQDGLLVKNQNQDGHLFVLAVSLLIGLQVPQGRHLIELADVTVSRESFKVLPPSRAPPAHSSLVPVTISL